MGNFDLSLKISVPEKVVKKKLGDINWGKLRTKTLKRDDLLCQGCGFDPKEIQNISEERKMKMLDTHIFNFDEENLSGVEAVSLCRACHSIQHIDVAIKNDWVKLVNSTALQVELITYCRMSDGVNHIESQNGLRGLRIKPHVFIDKLLAGDIKEDNTYKVLFTTIFDWMDN